MRALSKTLEQDESDERANECLDDAAQVKMGVAKR